MCGEKRGLGSTTALIRGSPPHVRGKARGNTEPCLIAGITPACAGKRIHYNRRFLVNWDHPRMCGEKFGRIVTPGQTMGSPPHVRGKVLMYDLWRKTYWDHPRMCGEKRLPKRRGTRRLGSPPHVRGKAAAEPFFSLNDGITPACAGKSERFWSRKDRFEDHPRMCGEKTTSSRSRISLLGSPPHVRGKVS